MIPFSTYLRIESKAGGADASVRSLLKQTKKIIKDGVSREDRHKIYRAILKCQKEVRGYRQARNEV